MHSYRYFDHNWLALKSNNEDVRRTLPLMKGVVYDLGCGRRPYEKDILAVAERYIGVDWGNTLHGLQADIVADLNQPLPIQAAVADTVVSFQVLEHLCEPHTMLGEAYRILKPGGVFFLSVPFQWWVHEAPYDFFRYTRYGLEYALKKAGFVDIRVTADGGFWSMWLLKLNYQTTRLIRGPRPLRWLVQGCLMPFWWLSQTIAPLLDRVWPSEEETSGYYASARKPQAADFG
jgi:SAM-dependent methyltransferase